MSGERAVAQDESTARRRVRRVGPPLVALGRLGYAAEGLVFVLVGIVALQVALGRGGTTADNRGVLPGIAAVPFGRPLLVAIAIGFAGYAAWRFLEAIFDPDGQGRDTHRLIMRLGNALNGAIHLGFAYSVVQLLRTGDPGSGTDATAKQGAAQLLVRPSGRWLVVIVGLVIIGYAAYQFFQAFKAKFRENARLRRMSNAQTVWYTTLGRVGFAARGIIFAAIGLFQLGAARDGNPQEARGLDTALADLATRPLGPWLLGTVALGLVVHGLFLLAEARFHRVRVA